MDFSGKNSGVGHRFHLQGIFLTQGSNPHPLHCRWILYLLQHWRSPREKAGYIKSFFFSLKSSPSNISFFFFDHLEDGKWMKELREESPTRNCHLWLQLGLTLDTSLRTLCSWSWLISQDHDFLTWLSSFSAWWAAVHGASRSRTRPSDFTFTLHFHALEKEMATHSSVLAWRIPGTAEPGGLPSMGSHRVGHDWSDLVAAAAACLSQKKNNYCFRRILI